ncbi:glutathione peroxidase [Glaciimonas sp. PAMC28666]|uniref:glutathione peroxidase n=1 Tax=Glaciimonas sp. PAMC28666 TaxID=2807626 RepID=UPI001964A90F|nr:glutathione peroxidase [Glaciimonas sp. PAMC28666]QRX80948.1 glutathione peroxidase [Glaciimonas sp. PAMC28666]
MQTDSENTPNTGTSVASASSANIYDFTVARLDGTPTTLAEYRGKVILIVNVASKCGFTPQYKGLEEVYNKYHALGFEVLGFPCNQFGAQEPGTAEEIGAFCEQNFGVHFPLFAKIDVNGDHAAPLFQYLKSVAPGLLGSEGIKWNFTKFLINKEGVVVDRYAPQTKPEALTADIEKLLAR